MKLIFCYVLAAALVVFFIIGIVGFIEFIKKVFEND
jgi:preprotein translocase subunit Sss1